MLNLLVMLGVVGCVYGDMETRDTGAASAETDNDYDGDADADADASPMDI
jgi:hypothetical protein